VIDVTTLLRLGLLLVRPGMLILVAPAFGGHWAPAQVKIGLILIIGLALAPNTAIPPVGTSIGLAVVVLHETAIGFALGLAIRALLAAAELGGQLSGFQMGLSYGATVDPQSGVRNPMLSTLYSNLTLMTFFLVNAHHAFLRALHQSYVALPIGMGGIDGSMPQIVVRMFALVFVLGVRIAAPILAVMIVTEVGLGFLARSAPSLNLMAVGPSVRAIVGLLLLVLAVPAIVGLVGGVSDSVVQLGVEAAKAFR